MAKPVESVVSRAPVTAEGALDEAAFKTLVEAAATAEIAYAQSAFGFGTGNVAGNGITPNISSGVGFCDTHVCHLGTSFNSTFTDNILRVGINYKWQ